VRFFDDFLSAEKELLSQIKAERKRRWKSAPAKYRAASRGPSASSGKSNNRVTVGGLPAWHFTITIRHAIL